MKRFLYLLLLTATTFVYGCSDYDDSQLSGRLDDIKERIAKLQDRIASLNSQLADLSELTSGNVITEMTEDSEGNYIITYKDNKNEEKSIVLATVDQMLNVPLLGIELDPQNNLYYWTVTADGKTSPLLDKAGEKVPVSGYTPEVSVDAEGFWTVNGERLNDAEGVQGYCPRRQRQPVADARRREGHHAPHPAGPESHALDSNQHHRRRPDGSRNHRI